jgi:hypothetical protein
MQIKRWRPHFRLTDHSMNLAAMMRLVVEEVKNGHGRRLHILLALMVGVGE